MRRLIRFLVFLVILGGLILGAAGYYVAIKPNVRSDKPIEFKVRSFWSYNDLLLELEYGVLKENLGFNILADQMNLQAHVYPGIYEIQPGMSNRGLITLLRTGQRKDVEVVIRSHIQGEDVYGILGRALESDSAEFREAFVQSNIFNDLGMQGDGWSCLFQANTYLFNWATKPEDVVKRFEREYTSFWNSSRDEKAKAKNLSRVEVVILASIVDGESTNMSEMPRIAGVYLNRLQNRWPLQADPTIMYFVREEGRQRVLNSDKEQDHPYNTYKNQGLPPGPIMIASSAAIEAVLNAEDHDFMFFCANPDFSQSHAFAKTLAEHERNARAYHRELNRRGIKR